MEQTKSAAVNGAQSETTEHELIKAERAAQYYARAAELFGARCVDIVERIDAGVLAFIDGVDLAYSAAIWSGLEKGIGDDAVQKIMAEAFGARRKP